MEPFYFGPADRRLFGVYHYPAESHGAPAGAVLCYPFLQEYFRAHRAFLRLAVQLASRGWHVLRFDYSGCGDSYGEEPRRPDSWADDLRMASLELQERAGSMRLALIGLRLGATLAATVAPAVERLSELVLWDPVVSGAGHLSEVLRLQHAATMPPGSLRKMERLCSQDRGVGVELSPVLVETIERLDLTKPLNTRAERVLVLDTQKSQSAVTLAERLGEIHGEVTLERLSEHPIWMERKRNDPRNITVPAASLHAIVSWLSQTHA